MELVPITFRKACAYIKEHHRHHQPPQGWRFGVALMEDDVMVGVAMAGRPVARLLDDGRTLEVTRLCTISVSKNATSKLYSAMRQAGRALGYKRIITYTLQEESGTSLKAAGWKRIGPAGGGTWNNASRKRVDKHPTGPKVLWEAP